MQPKFVIARFCLDKNYHSYLKTLGNEEGRRELKKEYFYSRNTLGSGERRREAGEGIFL